LILVQKWLVEGMRWTDLRKKASINCSTFFFGEDRWEGWSFRWSSSSTLSVQIAGENTC
jgi:hypothetical protein